MTAEERAAAKLAAQESKGAEVNEIKLVEPKQSTIVGSIELVNFRSANSEAGGKFSKDTHIISISVPTKGQSGIEFVSKTVYITDRQMKEYGVNKILYMGNYVKLTVEHCIADETGFKKEADDDFMTPHEKSFDAFVGAVEANVDSLYIYLDSIGVSERIQDRIITSVTNVRNTKSAIGAALSKDDGFNPFEHK